MIQSYSNSDSMRVYDTKFRQFLTITSFKKKVSSCKETSFRPCFLYQLTFSLKAYLPITPYL